MDPTSLNGPKMNEAETTSDTSSQNTEEGLQFLLGITPSDIDTGAWENESVNEDDTQSPSSTPRLERNKTTSSSSYSVSPHLYELSTAPLESREQEDAFKNAYHCGGYATAAISDVRPPIEIIDLSSQGRGRALIATRAIPRGQVIFTERAACAAQTSSVAACQHCFRSLATAKDCCTAPDTAVLPMSHLWPVLDLEFDSSSAESATNQQDTLRIDRYGRVQCRLCQTLFCSRACQKGFVAELRDCCLFREIESELPACLSMDGNEGEDDTVEPAIRLAVRMFVAYWNLQTCSSSSQARFSVQDLCGEASDLSALELGIPSRSNYSPVEYSLSKVHDLLLRKLAISKCGCTGLSLDQLERFASIAARNGVGIRTQSPFRSYYAALLRSVGGRNHSPEHQEMQEQVARALGSSTLQRGMDRLVDGRVAPEIVGLFLLLARMNHSCSPNAQVVAQEFVDYRVDVVALEDIARGQEISISYIGSGPQSGTGRMGFDKRQRELKSKYLFICQCARCSDEL